MMGQIETALSKIQGWYTSLSAREKGLVALLIASTLVIGGYSLADGVFSALATRKAELNAVHDDSLRLGRYLRQYRTLLAKKDAIEKQFAGVQGALPARSYIEQVAHKKADIQSTIDIKPLSTVPFGEHFSRSVFRVSFISSDLEQLTTFLREIDDGPQPLLVTRLDIRKHAARQLKVDIEISSIEPK